jgi:hypothetical protein
LAFEDAMVQLSEWTTVGTSERLYSCSNSKSPRPARNFIPLIKHIKASMTDPLSISLDVVTFSGLAGKCAKLMQRVIHDVKNAPETLEKYH